jgi:hypothetical protein
LPSNAEAPQAKKTPTHIRNLESRFPEPSPAASPSLTGLNRVTAVSECGGMSSSSTICERDIAHSHELICA